MCDQLLWYFLTLATKRVNGIGEVWRRPCCDGSDQPVQAACSMHLMCRLAFDRGVCVADCRQPGSLILTLRCTHVRPRQAASTESKVCQRQDLMTADSRATRERRL